MDKLRQNFIDELRDVLDAEKQILKALPKMAKAAKHDELKEAFENHLEQTEEQISRLEEVFTLLGEPARGKKCAGMHGLLQEGEEKIDEKAGDAALICAAQKVEHYEIASYGSLAAWGRLLEEEDAVALLDENLQEEKDTDERLTEIAEASINAEAEEEEEDEEDRGSKRGAKPRTIRK